MKIGFQELIVIFIVALLILGPDKLPEYARKFGEALKMFRKYSSEATKDIREGIVEPLNEAQKPLREAMEPINEVVKPIQDIEKAVKGDAKDLQKAFNTIGKEPVKKSDDTHPADADTAASDEAVNEAAASGTADTDNTSAAGSVSSADADAAVDVSDDTEATLSEA